MMEALVYITATIVFFLFVSFFVLYKFVDNIDDLQNTMWIKLKELEREQIAAEDRLYDTIYELNRSIEEKVKLKK